MLRLGVLFILKRAPSQNQPVTHFDVYRPQLTRLSDTAVVHCYEDGYDV